MVTESTVASRYSSQEQRRHVGHVAVERVRDFALWLNGTPRTADVRRLANEARAFRDAERERSRVRAQAPVTFA